MGLEIGDSIKALYTIDIFAHNIAIKKICNKKTILSHRFQWPTKVRSLKTFLDLCFVHVPWFILLLRDNLGL